MKMTKWLNQIKQRYTYFFFSILPQCTDKKKFPRHLFILSLNDKEKFYLARSSAIFHSVNSKLHHPFLSNTSASQWMIHLIFHLISDDFFHELRLPTVDPIKENTSYKEMDTDLNFLLKERSLGA